MKSAPTLPQELSVEEITKRLGRGQHYNTVLTLLQVMRRKKYVARRANGRQHVYVAKLSRDACAVRALADVRKLYRLSYEELVTFISAL